MHTSQVVVCHVLVACIFMLQSKPRRKAAEVAEPMSEEEEEEEFHYDMEDESAT